MRVLIVTGLYPPAVGGASTYFGQIAPRLARRAEIEEVLVLTERMPGQPHVWDENGLWLFRSLPTRISLQRRRWVIHASTFILTQLWFMRCLPGLVRRYRIDLVHFHTRYRGRLFYTTLRQIKIPVIADLRDKMTDPASLSAVVDHLVCCGEGVIRFAVDAGFPKDRVSLIPIPFDPPNPPSASAVSSVRRQYRIGQESYLLYVGDITYNKGVYDLLEAYRRWRVEHPDIALVLAGPNREGTRFLEQMRRTRGALYLGPVPHREAIALMRGAEIVLLPSRSEGLPRVILEAVSLGCKVICPPGIPEFERHLPQYVLPEVSVDAILRLLGAIWGCDDLPQYPFAEHRVDRVVGRLVSVYANVVEQSV